MSNGSDNKNKSEPAIVRLDETAVNEARSILFHAYRNEPTFQYLLIIGARLRSTGSGNHTGTDRPVF